MTEASVISDNTIPAPLCTVSVIVPVHNAGKYISECIDSILTQGDISSTKLVEGLEVIVVDDGSTDDTPYVLASRYCANPRVRVITTSNRGVSFARNTGIEVSRGKYLCFIDADDVMLPGALSKLLAIAHTQTHNSIICGTYISGVTLPEFPEYPESDAKLPAINSLSPEKTVKDILYQTSPITASVSAKLFPRHLFDDGMLFRVGYYYEDLDIVYKLILKADNIVFAKIPIFFYRRHPESFLNHWSNKRLDVLPITDFMQDYLTAGFGSKFKAAVNERILSANFNIFCFGSVNPGLVPTDIIESCWKKIKKVRLANLFNPRIRLKSRMASILSFGGRKLFTSYLRSHPGKYRL